MRGEICLDIEEGGEVLDGDVCWVVAGELWLRRMENGLVDLDVRIVFESGVRTPRADRDLKENILSGWKADLRGSCEIEALGMKVLVDDGS